MSDLPVLYSFRRCPYAMRARLAIRSSATCVEIREILLRDKAPEFLKTSPSGTVPCLITPQGAVIDESLDVMLWALRGNDPEGWLSPETGGIEDMLELIGLIDGDFKRHLDRYKYDTRFPDADRAQERSACAAFLMELDGRLTRSAWLYGEQACLADFAILPFVRQFANVDRDWFDAQPWGALARWLAGFEDSAAFAGVMTKLKVWQTGDEPVFFGR
ncbi:glutathione S-transferase [Roseibium litorale]|uniref:Glutathione S-transferase n=1 Tax=Roseibium litorale TaxID=2803841 RepID=A0ABR9CT57_9HYPH|nr:glutathione S-transferase [Roseibium litorale]MBD8893471.1 glutathione S-transferase [Roseibium litorale]